MPPSSQIRRVFVRGLVKEATVVWTVISGIITVIAGLGALVAHLEGWLLFDGLHCSFITGLTVGYGDLAPKGPISRILAIAIAFSGLLLTALLAAIAVRTLQTAAEQCKR